MFKPIMSNLLNKTIIIDLNEVRILSILKLNFIAQNNNNQKLLEFADKKSTN